MKEFVIAGPPGTGKTSEIKKIVQAMLAGGKVKNYEIGLTSFTKAGAVELTGGNPVPGSCIGTLHSFAFRGLGLEKDQVAESHLEIWNSENPQYRLNDGFKTANPDDAGMVENPAATEADQIYSQYNICRARLIKHDLQPPQVQRFAARWEAWKKEHSFFDFADMIDLAFESVQEMPVHYSEGSKKWTGPKVLFGDEFQDFTRAERRLFDKWARPVEMALKVGDADQTLYYFKGADPDGMYRPELPDMQKRSLKQSHRVPVAVHRAAVALINRIKHREQIDYLPTGVEGSVGQLECDFNHPERLIKRVEKDLAEGMTVGIMAPCSYQLKSILAVLRKEGIPFCNTYRLTRGDWNPVKTGGKSTSSAERLAAFLNPWYTGDSFKKWASLLDSKEALEHGQKTVIEHLEGVDLLSVETVLKMIKPQALAELMTLSLEDLPGLAVTPQEFLKDLVQPDIQVFHRMMTKAAATAMEFPVKIAAKQGAKALAGPYKLQVGTIHSFKGGQFDSTYIIPDLSAKGAQEAQSSRASRDAVIRMFYVALTRARLKATILAPGSPWGYKVL
ncbi:MAG: ATP-dependent helicase [Chloroflexi bacterium]|nr:ATP-dependent helicase [Chloroflexota bacterium]OJW05557.1 MAG: hypothetical protein BGO39_02770 [Chloroflexi bacterium 54-19]